MSAAEREARLLENLHAIRINQEDDRPVRRVVDSTKQRIRDLEARIEAAERRTLYAQAQVDRSEAEDAKRDLAEREQIAREFDLDVAEVA